MSFGAPGSVVSMKGLTRVYGADIRALDDIDLEIHRTEFMAIVGPSGSGKTTLLNVAGTLDRPSTGQVLVEGHDISRMDDDELSALRARRIGFVFQHFYLAAGVSALDNVADGMLYTGLQARVRRERAEAALRQVGLGDRLLHHPHQLSGGEKQRVAIARAVAREPALLLADEPTGALDSRTGGSVMDLLETLHAAGTAVVVITHDAAVASRCARQVSMRDGRIIADACSPRP